MRQINKRTLDNLIAIIIAQNVIFDYIEKYNDKDLWNRYIHKEREVARDIAMQISEKKKVNYTLSTCHICNLLESVLILDPIKKMNHKEIYEMLKCFDIEVVEEA